MSTTTTAKTRILILSDTHSALPFPSNTSTHPYRWPLPKANILIHAGDLTSTGTLEEHRKAIELISNVDAELKIVIPGNHDMTLHRDYCTGVLGKPNQHCPRYSDEALREIEKLYVGEEAKGRGIEYMVEGTKTFRLKNGVEFKVYANAWTPEFWNWGFGYPRKQDRFNTSSVDDDQIMAPNPVPDEGVDIMVTHGPPLGVLDKTSGEEDVGCEHLRRAVGRVKPKLHVFGHIHEAWGAVRKDWSGAKGDEKVKLPIWQGVVEKMGVWYDATALEAGKETLFVNASVMDLRYRPVQAPWVVDLMLPRT